MRHEFSYQITDELMRAGTRRFILHHFGWRVPVVTALLGLLLIPVCGSDDDHFMCGLFVGAIFLLFALPADKLAGEPGEFLAAKVKAAGGKII